MTLPSDTVKVQYDGNGSLTTFPITFDFWVNTDVKVIITVDSTGVETEWTEGSEYNITGHVSGVQGTGSVEVVTSPTDYTPATGVTVTIKSDIPLTQLTDLTIGGPFPSTDVEEQLSKNVRIVQQIEEEVERAVKLAETSEASDVLLADLTSNSGKVLRVNATETGFDYVDLTSGSVIATPVSIAEGGTGQITALLARAAFFADPDDLSQDSDMIIAIQVFGG